MNPGPSLSIAALLAFFSASPALNAQAAKPAPHHPATTAHRSTAATSAAPKKPGCPVATPELSPKIPALAPSAGCAKALYTLAYVDTEIGTGELAVPRKWYTVHYTGYLADGTKFDSSFDHPGAEPITFPYGARQVIPGWDTGFEGMHVGGKRRLYVPYQLAYGESGRPPIIPAKSELIFDVQLVSMSDTPPQAKPLPTPANPANPAKPSDAKPSDAKPADAKPEQPAESKPATEPKPGSPTPTQNLTPPSATKPKS